MKNDRMLFIIFLSLSLLFTVYEKSKVQYKKDLISDQSAEYQKELARELSKECERNVFCYL